VKVRLVSPFMSKNAEKGRFVLVNVRLVLLKVLLGLLTERLVVKCKAVLKRGDSCSECEISAVEDVIGAVKDERFLLLKV